MLNSKQQKQQASHKEAACDESRGQGQEAHPEADVTLANRSSPEEDHVQGFSVQAPLRLCKASVLAQVDELEVVHAQVVNAASRAPLADAMVLPIHTEVLEALLQCRVGLITYTHSTYCALIQCIFANILERLSVG